MRNFCLQCSELKEVMCLTSGEWCIVDLFLLRGKYTQNQPKVRCNMSDPHNHSSGILCGEKEEIFTQAESYKVDNLLYKRHRSSMHKYIYGPFPFFSIHSLLLFIAVHNTQPCHSITIKLPRTQILLFAAMLCKICIAIS